MTARRRRDPSTHAAQGHRPARRRPADDRRGRAADARRRAGHRLPLLQGRHPGPRDGQAEIGPTVILQDLVMPDIDGLTLVQHFRDDEATREIPMIVLSTKEEPDGQGRGLRAGGQRLHRQAPRPARAARPDPLPLQGLHRPPPAQRGLPGPPGEPEAAGQRRGPGRQVRPLAPARQAQEGADPDRLAVHPLGRARRRLVRLPLARRRPLRLLPARRQRPRRRRGLALGLGDERPAVAVAPADRLPRAPARSSPP